MTDSSACDDIVVKYRRLMVYDFAAQRLLLRGYRSVGVVRRRSGQQWTRWFAQKIHVKKRGDVISQRLDGLIRTHGSSPNRTLRQPDRIGRRQVFSTLEIYSEPWAAKIAPQAALFIAPLLAPHSQDEHRDLGQAR